MTLSFSQLSEISRALRTLEIYPNAAVINKSIYAGVRHEKQVDVETALKQINARRGDLVAALNLASDDQSRFMVSGAYDHSMILPIAMYPKTGDRIVISFGKARQLLESYYQNSVTRIVDLRKICLALRLQT